MCLLTTLPSLAQKTFDLKKYQWKNRLLFYFAPDDRQEAVVKQLELFEKKKSGIQERELAVITVFKDSGWDENGNRLSPEQAEQLRIKYGVRHPYTFVLVGKDGYEKYRNNEKLDLEDIFKRIDAMPMRQSEMKHK